MRVYFISIGCVQLVSNDKLAIIQDTRNVQAMPDWNDETI